MRIVLITGSRPPEICGVGDYTAILAETLAARGLDVSVFHSADWTPWRLGTHARALAALKPDLYHLQYPTMGYRRSLVPSLLPLTVRRAPFVVTLHEFSVFRRIRRPWFLPFARVAALVFTNELERERFRAFAPRSRARTAVIPIGSNIPAAGPTAREARTVVHFGQLSPYKGVRDFLAFAKLAGRAQPPFALRIIGGVPERFRSFAADLVAEARAGRIELVLDRPPHEVAQQLARAAYAYLPFYDGATVKRGSLLAAIVNGVTIVTRHSEQTPDFLRAATVHADTPADALAAIERLESDPHARAALAAAQAEAAQRFQWPEIAARHEAFYTEVLGAGR